MKISSYSFATRRGSDAVLPLPIDVGHFRQCQDHRYHPRRGLSAHLARYWHRIATRTVDTAFVKFLRLVPIHWNSRCAIRHTFDPSTSTPLREEP
jgi:hypothetical protein